MHHVIASSNYTAEYGARNGGQLNVTIKNGTGQFHGTAYYIFRHEEFNANEFFNNKLGVVKPGAFADLLLVDGDPTANLKLIADPEKNFLAIMKDGRVVKDAL